jgi:hypothetical protein
MGRRQSLSRNSALSNATRATISMMRRPTRAGSIGNKTFQKMLMDHQRQHQAAEDKKAEAEAGAGSGAGGGAETAADYANFLPQKPAEAPTAQVFKFESKGHFKALCTSIVDNDDTLQRTVHHSEGSPRRHWGPSGPPPTSHLVPQYMQQPQFITAVKVPTVLQNKIDTQLNLGAFWDGGQVINDHQFRAPSAPDSPFVTEFHLQDIQRYEGVVAADQANMRGPAIKHVTCHDGSGPKDKPLMRRYVAGPSKLDSRIEAGRALGGFWDGGAAIQEHTFREDVTPMYKACGDPSCFHQYFTQPSKEHAMATHAPLLEFAPDNVVSPPRVRGTGGAAGPAAAAGPGQQGAASPPGAAALTASGTLSYRPAPSPPGGKAGDETRAPQPTGGSYLRSPRVPLPVEMAPLTKRHRKPSVPRARWEKFKKTLPNASRAFSRQGGGSNKPSNKPRPVKGVKGNQVGHFA